MIRATTVGKGSPFLYEQQNERFKEGQSYFKNTKNKIGKKDVGENGYDCHCYIWSLTLVLLTFLHMYYQEDGLLWVDIGLIGVGMNMKLWFRSTLFNFLKLE